MQVIAAPAGADLIQAEPHMDEEHEDDGHPVIELGEYRRECVEIIAHRFPPKD
jgi:hypothetical protein